MRTSRETNTDISINSLTQNSPFASLRGPCASQDAVVRRFASSRTHIVLARVACLRTAADVGAAH